MNTRNNTAKVVSTGGLMTSLAVIFQSAPVMMPGLGMLISPLALFPVAMAGYFRPAAGVLTWLAASCILLAISPQEALILMFTSGPLGVMLGITGHRLKAPLAVLLSSGVLFVGLAFLTYVIGFPVFGRNTSALFGILPGFLLLFSFLYSFCMLYAFKLLVKYLR